MTTSQKWINRKVIYAIIFVLLLLGLAWSVSKVESSNAPPTVKIGLVAPFEGLYRSTGYEVLFAVKLALQERNQGDGLNGYRVELVALNDFNHPTEARRQAQVLVADPDVVGVVGHLSSDSTLAAMPVYRQAQLAMVIPWSVEKTAFNSNSPGVVRVAAAYEETVEHLKTVSRQMGFARLTPLATVDDVEALSDPVQALQLTSDAVTAGNIMLALNESGLSLPLFGQVEAGNRQLVQVAGAAANSLIFVSPGPDAADVSGHRAFVEAYEAMAGFPPGPRAVLAYDATHILLDSIEQVIILNDRWYNHQPIRAAVSNLITSIQREGMTGHIAFDTYGQRLNAPVWVYQISEARYPGTLMTP